MLRECVSAINDVVTFEMTEKNFEAKLLANELSKEDSDLMISFGVAETALKKGVYDDLQEYTGTQKQRLGILKEH